MKAQAEPCEIGEIIGKRIYSYKPRKCKRKDCKTILNSYHDGKYCHAHESAEIIKKSLSNPFIGISKFCKR